MDLYDHIYKLPNNIHELAGENGTKLSGGQCQRLGIVRALYRNPSIIILDEATSSLDEQTEELIIKQLFNNTEKFEMQTQPQLLLLQKTMVVVEGVARRLDPTTNIWEVSKPILENWLRESKDPLNKINETLENASDIIKKIPELPKIMDKANDALTIIAEGRISPNSTSYYSLKEEELKMKLFRNNLISIFLVLVIFLLLVFK